MKEVYIFHFHLWSVMDMAHLSNEYEVTSMSTYFREFQDVCLTSIISRITSSFISLWWRWAGVLHTCVLFTWGAVGMKYRNTLLNNISLKYLAEAKVEVLQQHQNVCSRSGNSTFSHLWHSLEQRWKYLSNWKVNKISITMYLHRFPTTTHCFRN